MIDWLQSLFGFIASEQVRATITVLGGIGTFIGAIAAIVAIFERRGRRILDERLKEAELRLAAREKELRDKQIELDEREIMVAGHQNTIDSVRIAVLRSDEQLWEMYDPRPFAGYHGRISDRRPMIITIGNLKGGVGKTTLAANLAADFAISGGKRVLLVDLDYQGSLSTMLFSAAGRQDVPSRTEGILDGTILPESIHNAATNISLQVPALPNTWLVPAYYSLAARENQLMVEWLMSAGATEVRYRLAQFLLSDTVRALVDLVILDTPPRLTTGTVNALCASTHFVVPTRLDMLSAETVGSFVNAVKKLKNRLNPNLAFGGVIGTMTAQQQRLTPLEEAAKARIREQLEHVWPQNPHIFERHIPDRVGFSKAAGQQIAYLQDPTVRELIGQLGAEIRSEVVG